MHAFFLERRDLAAVAAIDDVDLRVAFDVAHEADAARAEDAAVAVEHQRRPEVDVGLHAFAVERPARKLHPALVGSERVREVLQRALAALVADRTVERMVDQQELEDSARARRRSSGVRVRPPCPSAQTVEHDVCSFGIFSILTMHTRHEPSMPMPG